MIDHAAPGLDPWPEVLSATELANSFLGGLLEICLVTSDHQVHGGARPPRDRSVADLHVRLAHGHRAHLPRCLRRLRSQGLLRRGRRAGRRDHAAAVRPLRLPGASRPPRRGIHHVAFDIDHRPWEERLAASVKRGCAVSQSGRFVDQNAFAFFDTEHASGTTFETYDIPPEFVRPEPEAWFPGPPPGGQR